MDRHSPPKPHRRARFHYEPSRFVLEPGVSFKRMSEGAAGFDLCALEDVDLEAGRPTPVRTGVKVALQRGTFGLIKSRSSMALRNNVHVDAGVIDEDYRGEIQVVLRYGERDGKFTIRAGERIAQMIVLQYYVPAFQQVETLDATERGSGGFGSTGK